MEKNMGNYRTGSGSRKHDNWYYLDKLPRRLRMAIAHAAYVWDAKWFYDHWNKGKSVDWCISELKRWDLNEAQKDVKWREGFKWAREKSPAKATKLRPLYPKHE
jgi:hypothetical protein